MGTLDRNYRLFNEALKEHVEALSGRIRQCQSNSERIPPRRLNLILIVPNLSIREVGDDRQSATDPDMFLVPSITSLRHQMKTRYLNLSITHELSRCRFPSIGTRNSEQRRFKMLIHVSISELKGSKVEE